MTELSILTEKSCQEGLALILESENALMLWRSEGDDPSDSIYIEVPIPYDQLLEGACALKQNKLFEFGDNTHIAFFAPYGNNQFLLNMKAPGHIGANIHGLNVEINKQVLEDLAKHAEEKTRPNINFNSSPTLESTIIEQILGEKAKDSRVMFTDLGERSALPLVLVQVDNKYILAIKQSDTRFQVLQPNIKRVKDMEPVAYPAEDDLDNIVYQVYRNVHRPRDEKRIITNGLRYDITIVAPGNIGFQKNKTYGHYHPSIDKVLSTLTKKDISKVVQELSSSSVNIDGVTNDLYSTLNALKPIPSTFLELCQVISGTALYLMQNVDGNNVKDVVEIICKPGEFVIIPANYGHLIINETKEPVVTAHWVANFFNPEYSEFTSKGGAAILYMASGDTARNLRYANNSPDARVAKPHDFQYPLTNWDEPIYKLIENPTQLRFLLGK